MNRTSTLSLVSALSAAISWLFVAGVLYPGFSHVEIAIVGLSAISISWLIFHFMVDSLPTAFVRTNVLTLLMCVGAAFLFVAEPFEKTSLIALSFHMTQMLVLMVYTIQLGEKETSRREEK